MRKFIFLILVALPFFSNSQSSNPENIFWEIKGNGLTKPSFLYGTMHIMDDRAFNFNDSLFIKMKECDAFALEVHPDSVLKKIFADFFTRREKEDNKLKEILNEDEYEKLSKTFRERTGFELEDVNTSNPTMIKDLITRDYSGKADNSTFLDAYLYQVAKSWGKKVVGVEKYDDQIKALELSDSELKKSFQQIVNGNDSIDLFFEKLDEFRLENLIGIYQQGNLEVVDEYLRSHSSDSFYQKLIVDRNRVMLENSIREMHTQPIFIAVGVGHLGGEFGLVELLRTKGYQVRPVTPLYTGKAKKIKINSKNEKWHKFVSEELGYSLELPQEPFDIKLESLPMKMYMYPDLGTGLVYINMAINTMGSRKEKEVLSIMADRLINNVSGEVMKEKKIKHKGNEGKEIVFKDRGLKYYKIRMIIRDGHLYVYMVGSKKREELDSFEAMRFLNSLEFIEFERKQNKMFVSTEGSFSVLFPGEPKKMVQRQAAQDDPSSLFTFNIYLGADIETKLNFLVTYYDLPAGSMIEDDSVYVYEISNEYLKNLKAKKLKSAPLKKDRFFGVHTEGSGAMGHFFSEVFVRGNRCYSLTVLAADSLSYREKVNGFFESFAFLDFEPASWTSFEEENGIFSIDFPGEVKFSSDTTGYFYSANDSYVVNQYTSVDANSGESYAVLEEVFSKYCHFENVDAYFDEYLDTYKETYDSIYVNQDFSWGDGNIGKGLLVKSDQYSYSQIIKIFPLKDRVLSLWAYKTDLTPEDSIQIDHFLSSFDFKESDSEMNLFKTKEEAKKLLLADAKSDDLKTIEHINQVIRDFSFTPDDLPTIYDLIKWVDAEFSEEHLKLKSNLIESVGENSDKFSVAFLKDQYNQQGDSSEIRLAVLEALADINTAESLIAFKDILIENPPKTKQSYKYYSIFYHFDDSIENFALIFPDLFQLFENEDFGNLIINTTISAIDSGAMSIDELVPFAERVNESFQRSYHELIAIHPDSSGYYTLESKFKDMAGLLAYVSPDGVSREILTQIDTSFADYVLLSVVEAQLKQEMPINELILKELCENDYWLIDVVELLGKEKKLDLLPEEYRSQKKIARSQMYNYLDYYDEYTEDIELLETRDLDFKDEKVRVFIFKMGYTYEDDNGDETTDWYLGFCGLFDQKDSQIVPIKKMASTTGEVYVEGETDVSKTLVELMSEDAFY